LKYISFRYTYCGTNETLNLCIVTCKWRKIHQFVSTENAPILLENKIICVLDFVVCNIISSLHIYNFLLYYVVLVKLI
jgi:hypothetical protein